MEFKPEVVNLLSNKSIILSEIDTITKTPQVASNMEEAMSVGEQVRQKYMVLNDKLIVIERRINNLCDFNREIIKLYAQLTIHLQREEYLECEEVRKKIENFTKIN